MKPTPEQLEALQHLVAATRSSEIDCDELLARVGRVLENLGPDDELPDEFRQVSQHLAVCPECREEFDLLVKLHRSHD